MASAWHHRMMSGRERPSSRNALLSVKWDVSGLWSKSISGSHQAVAAVEVLPPLWRCVAQAYQDLRCVWLLKCNNLYQSPLAVQCTNGLWRAVASLQHSTAGLARQRGTRGNEARALPTEPKACNACVPCRHPEFCGSWTPALWQADKGMQRSQPWGNICLPLLLKADLMILPRKVSRM